MNGRVQEAVDADVEVSDSHSTAGATPRRKTNGTALR